MGEQKDTKAERANDEQIPCEAVHRARFVYFISLSGHVSMT